MESEGVEADFRRSDITILRVFGRFFSKKIGLSYFDYKWFPSVFKIFSHHSYETLGGYDENIFMYYEDYDICMRARKKGMELEVLDAAYVIPPSSRSSRKKIKLFLIHINSIYYVLRKKIIGEYK